MRTPGVVFGGLIVVYTPRPQRVRTCRSGTGQYHLNPKEPVVPFTAYDFFAYLASGALIVATVDVLHGKQWLLTKEHPVALDVFLVLTAYVIGHVIAQLSATVFESLFVERGLLRPSYTLMGKTRPGFRYIFRLYCKPLRIETRERVIQKAHERSFAGSGEALFLHALGLVKQEPLAMARLDQFRNLYGFARNMALSLFLVAAIIAIGPTDSRPSIPSAWAWYCLGLGLVMLYRYLKFFRQYSYEVLVTYAELSPRAEAVVKK
jgi:hypothetical protein